MMITNPVLIQFLCDAEWRALRERLVAEQKQAA